MEAGFKGYHPVPNLIYFLSIVIFSLLFKHPLTLAVCFAASICYYIKLCGRQAVKNFFCVLLPMLVVVLLINGIFAHYGTTPIFTLPSGNKMTFEAIVYGFVLGLSAVTVMMWFFCYNEVVTADKFMFVFGKFLPAAALVFSMALRFVPLYKNRLYIIAEAQRGIGKDYKSGTLLERIKNGGKIMSILITWSLENAVEISDSMRARGYGLKGRKAYGKFKWSGKDFVAVFVIILIDILLIFGCIFKSVHCVYNPYIVINPKADFGKTYFVNQLNLTLNPTSFFGIITLIAFTVLCFLPLIIELKEDIKWNRLKSKI
ncbi:MAG: energy-coupling factor transporter transmembrane protein EcfT [Clostridia bacterium]|nr:energy-coupling factor transporter transmembrane protein EcfT [Clostridia bacterium]